MTDSSLGRFASVLTSPTKTFVAIRERPTWLVALVVMILLGAGVTWLLTERVDMAEFGRESIEASGREMPEEAIETAMDVWDRFGVLFFMIPIVGMPFFYALGTLCLWVASKLVGAELSFKQMWSTFIYSQVPASVAGLLMLPAIFSRDEFRLADFEKGSLLPSNLAYLAPEETGKVVLALLASVDVFTLWSLVLLVLGISTVGRIKTSTAAFAVAACWLLFVLGKAGLASLG